MKVPNFLIILIALSTDILGSQPHREIPIRSSHYQINTQTQFYEIKNLDNLILGFDLDSISEKELFYKLNSLTLTKEPINRIHYNKVDTLLIFRKDDIEIKFYKVDNSKRWLESFEICSDILMLYKGIHIGLTKEEVEKLLPNLKILSDKLSIGEIGPTTCDLIFSNRKLICIKYRGYSD
jgi:hypothetical protein